MKKFISIITAGSLFFGAALAYAAVTPTVTTTVQNSGGTIVTSAPIGSAVADIATVASSTGTTPSGTVDFSLYPNTSCSGVPTVQSGVALVNGSAVSGTTTVPSTGLSYLVNYDGDDTYGTTTGSCEPVTALSSTTGVSTTLSTTSVMAGSSVFDSAALSGVTADAGGTVNYTVYNDSACSIGAESAGTESVTNGIAPNSGTVEFNTPGTYYWQAVYSGDTNNAIATSTCGSEVLTVVATSTSTTGTTTPSGTSSISGTVYNDLNRDGVLDNNEPGLSGWTINLYNNPGWSGPTNIAPFMTTVSDANGNYSFTGLAAGTYSIEEINQPSGLNQFTSDYSSVVVASDTALTGMNFGNVAGNSYGNGSQNQKGNGNGKQGCASSTPGKSGGDKGYQNQGGNNNGNQGKDSGYQAHGGFGNFFGTIKNVVSTVGGHFDGHK